jgi:hypothetical protein
VRHLFGLLFGCLDFMCENWNLKYLYKNGICNDRRWFENVV